MEYLNDLFKAQDLLKKGNQIIACKSLDGAVAEISKNNGLHPRERRMGVIKDIGLKDGEIVIDFDVLVEIKADGKPEVYSLPDDGNEVELPTMSAFCYLNQVLSIIEIKNQLSDYDFSNRGTIWNLDEEPFTTDDIERDNSQYVKWSTPREY